MEQISAGVEFVRACKQVHRDLKPRNGKYPKVEVNPVSVVFNGVLENRRLRLVHLLDGSQRAGMQGPRAIGLRNY